MDGNVSNRTLLCEKETMKVDRISHNNGFRVCSNFNHLFFFPLPRFLATSFFHRSRCLIKAFLTSPLRLESSSKSWMKMTTSRSSWRKSTRLNSPSEKKLRSVRSREMLCTVSSPRIEMKDRTPRSPTASRKEMKRASFSSNPKLAWFLLRCRPILKCMIS